MVGVSTINSYFSHTEQDLLSIRMDEIQSKFDIFRPLNVDFRHKQFNSDV